MRRFFTVLKWIFIVLILFVAHAYITGNSHVFKTLSYTVLKGRLNPGIDTRKIFPVRKVNTGKPMPWVEDPALGNLKADKKVDDLLKKYETVSFLIIRNNKVYFEDYRPGYGRASYTNSWSVAKSLIGILVGVAIREGKIKSTEQMVSDFLPEYKGTGLRIRHLLTMSSGINFREQYMNPYGYNAKSLYGDDLKTLNSKYRVNHTPGKNFIYLSGNTQVLGFLLEKATGKSISEYASEKVWQKIGAEHPAYWSLDQTGRHEKAFCCFHTNARDFARLGQLMLQHGIWGNDTLITEDYFRASVTPARLKDNEGKPSEIYGYQWWLARYKGMDIFYARGILGQYIIVIPERNVVIVRLGHKRNSQKLNGHPMDFYEYTDAALSLIP